MAAGCPVIGANRGGIPDIITDGVNGCLFDPDSKNEGSDSLIHATQRVLNNDLEHQSMRKAARVEAEQWGWESATAQLKGYYNQILKEQQSIKIAA